MPDTIPSIDASQWITTPSASDDPLLSRVTMPPEIVDFFDNEKIQVEIRESLLADREKKISADLAARSKTLQEREANLSAREKEMSAHFAKMQREHEALQEKVIAERKSLLEEKERVSTEYQELLEKNSTEYIEATLINLNNRYAELDGQAGRWQIAGALSLVVGLFVLIYTSIQIPPLDPALGWKHIAYIGIRGSALLALIGAFTAYSARTSKAIRAEAKLIHDRKHAIDYGAFFLKTHGKNANWSQIENVFKDWNPNHQPTPPAQPTASN